MRFDVECCCMLLVPFAIGMVSGERTNYCPRTCIRGVQQFPFSEICICPEYCPFFCCAGYYYYSPVHGACPTTCGVKSRPIYTECCLPGGFADPGCIIAQKRWFDANTRGIWWWPAVFNDTSTRGQHSEVRALYRDQQEGSSSKKPFTTLALVKPGGKPSVKVLDSNSITSDQKETST